VRFAVKTFYACADDVTGSVRETPVQTFKKIVLTVVVVLATMHIIAMQTAAANIVLDANGNRVEQPRP
jgi:hypothetical protein